MTDLAKLWQVSVMKSAGSLHLDSSLYPEQEIEHENMNESNTVDWYHAY